MYRTEVDFLPVNAIIDGIIYFHLIFGGCLWFALLYAQSWLQRQPSF